MKNSEWHAFIFAAACLSLWAAGCGSEEKAEKLDRLPCVRSLTILKDDPLRIHVVTAEGSGGVFIRTSNKPKELHSSVDVFIGQTFVVHTGRTGYDFTLEGMQDELLKFSTTIVENCGIPQHKLLLVEPYTKRK